MKKDENIIYGEVAGEFIVVDTEIFGELYQETIEEGIRLFEEESDGEKLEIFEAYKEDSIYNGGSQEEWEEFYGGYKNK